MKYLFGPVNSRRLGLSQGIDILPSKICNFNCIYCEVGKTTRFTCERKEYSPTAEILSEIDSLLSQESQDKPIDVFTITGSGEPTLHSDIGKIIRYIKENTSKPVVVLTNGSLLHLQEVREDLKGADIVIPSLDSAREKSYRLINRPEKCAQLSDIILGQATFSKEFKGKLWLEILFAKGINDSEVDILALQEAIEIIKPNRIQLNTVARPPLEKFCFPLTKEKLEEIAKKFSGEVDIIAHFNKRAQSKAWQTNKEEIISLIKRRPCTLNDIHEALNTDLNQTFRILSQLSDSGLIEQVQHQGKEYYQLKT